MLQTSSSAAPKNHGSSAHNLSEATTSSTAPGLPRYYRSNSADNIAINYSSPTHDGPASAVIESQISLDETRRGALQTLAMCRHVITTLELTRLRKSRRGICQWLRFWDHLYERSLCHVLSHKVSATLFEVDELFRAVSVNLQSLTQRMEEAVELASSEEEILHLLESMEDEVGVCRRRRRRKAQHILKKMRSSIEDIPVKVNDELFDDMKRGIFALDVFCDYHPGDSVAEEIESMWSHNFFERPVALAAVSPYLYQQCQQSATSGAYMPLTAYSSNINFSGSAEEWVSDMNNSDVYQ